MATRRVMVVGLDCVPPRFAFDLYRDLMPNLGSLMARGVYGPMRSCEPPITVPAWSAMFSGRDPGELGIYGFQQPIAGTYDKRLTAFGSEMSKVQSQVDLVMKSIQVLHPII